MNRSVVCLRGAGVCLGVMSQGCDSGVCLRGVSRGCVSGVPLRGVCLGCVAGCSGKCANICVGDGPRKGTHRKVDM